MILLGDQNTFVRNIITNTARGLYIKGVLMGNTLYMITLNGILFEVNLNGMMFNGEACGFTTDSLKQHPEYVINDRSTFFDVYTKIEQIKDTKTKNQIVFFNNDMRSDPNFEAIVTAKSADGATNYFFSTDTGLRTFITLYRGIFNLTKADKVMMKVFNTTDDRILLANFTIYKKKINTSYDINFYFMHFDQRRIL